jgi:MFS family permease
VLALLRRNRDLRLLFGAQVVSFLGDWFADVALLGLVLDLTHSSVAASLVLVASMLPVFLVTPLAGAAVDNLDRRKLIVGVSVLQCLAALALLGVGPGEVWLAFVARGAIAALGAFVAPASQAAIPNLVDEEDLAKANALLGSVWGAMLAAGAAIGGAFTVAFGRNASFVADALTFVVAGALVFAIRRPMSQVGNRTARRVKPIGDTVEALRYAHGNRDVRYLLFSKMGLGLAGGVVPLLAVYGKEVFHGGDAAIGLLLAARGFGALLGPIVGGRATTRGVAGILGACGVAAIVYGAGYAVVAAAPVLAIAFVGAFVAHLGGGAQWTLSNIGLQVAVPDELRGRIFAADFALVTLSMSASMLLAGWGASHVGARPVTVVLAAIATLWGFAYLGLTQAVRSSPATVTAPTER